jgi:Ser/Thr protein kinase RdoA (MazF antagonist)
MTEAEEAAGHWGGAVTRLIAARENTVYELVFGNGQRAALRLHRTAYQTADAIRAELDWCACLATAGLPVATPLPTLRGAHLVRLSNGRHASATHWIEGQPMGSTAHPLSHSVQRQIDLHRKLGRLLAEIHGATDDDPPTPFPRPVWDIDGLTGDAPFWGRFWEHPAAPPDQARILRAARAHLRDALEALHAPDQGPIHADVLRENVIVNGDTLSLIDFDDCGTGFRLYDLGTALLANWNEPARSALRDALIAGYSETRPADPATVDLMTLARACASVGWTMPRLPPDDPIHRSHIARAVTLAEWIGV